mgnify:CR=1 FL=1
MCRLGVLVFVYLHSEMFSFDGWLFVTSWCACACVCVCSLSACFIRVCVYLYVYMYILFDFYVCVCVSLRECKNVNLHSFCV